MWPAERSSRWEFRSFIVQKTKSFGAKESDIPGKKILSYKAGRFQVS